MMLSRSGSGVSDDFDRSAGFVGASSPRTRLLAVAKFIAIVYLLTGISSLGGRSSGLPDPQMPGG